MTNDAQRIFRLEGLVRTLSQQVLALQIALAQTAQNQATAGVVGGGSSSSALPGAFVAMPSVGIFGVAGRPPANVPFEAPADIYQLTDVGGVSLYTYVGRAPVWNPSPTVLPAGVPIPVVPTNSPSGGYLALFFDPTNII